VNTDDIARVSRLALVMQLRDATFAPVALAAKHAGTSLLIGASAHGERLEVVMDYSPEAHEALAAGVAALPGTTQLRVRIDGDDAEVMFVRAATGNAEEVTTELAPAAHLEAWQALVVPLCSICDGTISGVGKNVQSQRALIQIGYPARGRDDDAMLIEALDELGGPIGLSAAQRSTLLRRLHPELGRGAPLVISTWCNPSGVSAHLGLSYPVTSWETALRLASGLVFNDSVAKDVSTRLGQVAGAVGSEVLQGVQLVLGPHEPPDVVVWARIAPR
jgi:hypothetical protein